MSNGVFLGLTVFIACLVEMIEALTIILALGITRGWRSVILATIAAVLTLALIVGVFGKTLLSISRGSNSSLKHLWLIMGTLLLIFGIQWMRKAVLRIGSVMPSRDEDEIFKKVSSEARKTGLAKNAKVDWYAFLLAYKGVLLEGFEVIFIVITFGVSQGDFSTGILSALLALVAITILGLFIHRPLAQIPENIMKLIVGILLTTFGTYFAVKGIGLFWPHGDTAVWGILVFYIAVSYLAIKSLKVSYKPR